MNKLVSLGLLAAAAIFAAQSVFADDIAKCEEFKGGTPGLYGLCKAYVNAGNDNARYQIEKDYAKRAGFDDPATLYDFFNEAPCACWNRTMVSLVACSSEYVPDTHVNFYDYSIPLAAATYDESALGFMVFGSACSGRIPDAETMGILNVTVGGLTAEEINICLDDIADVVDGLWDCS